MSLGTILLIVLILMLLGAIPTWPHSRSWGYFPSGGLGLIVLILIILVLLGKTLNRDGWRQYRTMTRYADFTVL